MQSCLGCIRETFRYFGASETDTSHIIAHTLEPYYSIIRQSPRYQDYLAQRSKIYTGALPDKKLPFTEEYLRIHAIRSGTTAKFAGTVNAILEQVELCLGKRSSRESALEELQEVIVQRRKCSKGVYLPIEDEAGLLLNQMLIELNFKEYA